MERRAEQAGNKCRVSWGRLSAGFPPLFISKRHTNKQLLDNNSADPSRVAAARGDGAVIDRGPGVCGRVHHQEAGEEGKTAASWNFIRLPPFPATCPPSAFIGFGGARASPSSWRTETRLRSFPPIRPLTTHTFVAVKTCQTSVAFSRLRSLPVQPAAPRRRGYAVRGKWEKEACVCVSERRARTGQLRTCFEFHQRLLVSKCCVIPLAAT